MIRQIFSQRNFNWVLKLGTLSLILGFIILFISADDITPEGFGGLSFEQIFFMAVFIAPFLEETTFRGQHSSNRTIKIVSLIAIILLTISQYSEWLNFTLGLALIIVILLSRTERLSRDKFLPSYIILNSVLFALVHLSEGEFGLNIDTFLVLIQLGAGLIFNWICLNFKLRNAIYIHMSWNFMLFTILFFALQFPFCNKVVKETEHGILSYEQVPFYDGKPSKFQINSSEVTLEGQGIDALFRYLELADKGKSTDDFLINAPFFRFNLNYTSKHDTIFYQDFFEALQKEELISLAKKSKGSLK
ncbi:type II CAAX prenyl endopeptidase Rce1 family protein [Roseivirga sp.]|uniref:CPBP family glutamic-type intramembrane protease n=1 Tax=Roseivirga sp. TaxID=1964215 RepID=UPI002B276292|nr:CPBP family glutamic-type intramembrane protease [Roseivirga sp.]